MAAKFFAPAVISEVKELTEGFFNVAYKISLNDGQNVILKVAPKKEVRIMAHEQNIMKSEGNPDAGAASGYLYGDRENHTAGK